MSVDRVVYPLPPLSAIERTRDLSYRPSDEAAKFDLYRPLVGAEPMPVAVFVHGDTAYSEQLRDVKDWGQFISWGELCAAHGLAAITFNHRSSHRLTRVRDVIDDIEAMLNHVEAASDSLRLDASRLALFAISMGVPCALWVAFDWYSRLRCAVAFYGPMDLPERELGHAPAAAANSPEDFSPLNRLASGQELPPLFIARAGRDRPELNDSIDNFVQQALTSNQHLDLHNHAYGPHAFDLHDPSPRSREIIDAALQFLRARLDPAGA